LRRGGELLAEMLPRYLKGEITPKEQNHTAATFSKKIQKADGLIYLDEDPKTILRKVYAFEGWPGVYTFFTRNDKKIRVAILDAHLEKGALVVDTIQPEGKRPMPYQAFLNSGATPMSS
jgi:methionyl-tRNA formyltransferase